MGGSDGAIEDLMGRGRTRPGRIGSRRHWFSIEAEGGRGGSSIKIDRFPVVARGPRMVGTGGGT